MFNSKLAEEISSKISMMMHDLPTSEIEKNLRALLQGAFTKMELVSREEFDVQSQVLLRTREQLQQLEKKLADLESSWSNRQPLDKRD